LRKLLPKEIGRRPTIWIDAALFTQNIVLEIDPWPFLCIMIGIAGGVRISGCDERRVS
jgi:hypothetical protein